MKQISLHITPFSKAHNLSVSVSIPFKCNELVLSALQSNNPCNHSFLNIEESVIAYSLFILIKEKMLGSPLEIARSKVDHIICNCHGSFFVISWNTQGTGSALRKTIGVVLKCLSPPALFSKYVQFMKNLQAKPDRSVFNYVANKMIESLNKSIDFLAIGKINPSITSKDILEVASKKFIPSKKLSDATPPGKNSSGSKSDPALNVQRKEDVIECENGAAAIVVADYILHSGLLAKVCDKNVLIFNPQLWNSKRDGLKQKPRIQKYIETKYDKLQDLSLLYLAYTANSSGLGTADTIKKLLKADPKQYLLKNL